MADGLTRESPFDAFDALTLASTLDESLHAVGLTMTSRVSGHTARETFMGGRAIQIVVDVAIIAGAIVSLALLALAFLFD